MAQGKLKVKAKLPKSVKKSQQNRPKGPAIQRRGSEFQLHFLSNNDITLSIIFVKNS